MSKTKIKCFSIPASPGYDGNIKRFPEKAVHNINKYAQEKKMEIMSMTIYDNNILVLFYKGDEYENKFDKE